jgi:hypothetical protein
MDKLKIFLANAKKYQFWICCGVMLLTSLGCWWWASGALAKIYDGRKTAIDADFAGATVQPDAPNQKIIDKVKQQDDELKQKVYHAWEMLYNEQKKNDYFPVDVLGKEFQKAFAKLRLPKDELDPKYLDIYENKIKDYLPELEKIVKVRHEVDNGNGTAPGGAPMRPRQPGLGGFGGVGGAGRGGMPLMPGGVGGFGGFGGGGRGGMPLMPGGVGGFGGGGRPLGPPGAGLDADREYTGIVDWDESDRALLATHFDWGNHAPTTIEVAMAQEDLCVYRALLQIIKKVNAEANTQANASIKRIVALEIGRDSVPGWDEARQAVFVQPMTGTPGQQGDPRGMGGMGGNAMGGPASHDQQAEETLFKNRYIGEKGAFLPYDPEYPHAKHPKFEYKMMPVYMSFVMDQRRLPTLLVTCANSSMPIEVRGIRVLKEAVPPFDPGGGAAGMGMPGAMGHGMSGMPPPMGPMAPGGMRGGMRGQGPMAPPPRPSGGAPAGGGGPQDVTGQFDVPVQICAVIYIYNPPNREKLGMPEEKNPAEAAAPATSPPANVPATPPSPNPTPGK